MWFCFVPVFELIIFLRVSAFLRYSAQLELCCGEASKFCRGGIAKCRTLSKERKNRRPIIGRTINYIPCVIVGYFSSIRFNYVRIWRSYCDIFHLSFHEKVESFQSSAAVDVLMTSMMSLDHESNSFVLPNCKQDLCKNKSSDEFAVLINNPFKERSDDE